MRYAGNSKITLNQSEQDSIGYGQFSCPVAADAAAKEESNLVPLWRYEYFGDWPNLRLYPGSGAYHTSEVSMVFGTMEDLTGDPNTVQQVAVSAYMMGAWATFARDPTKGLSDLLGWPEYNKSGEPKDCHSKFIASY
jgi:carboxylesterase type B